MSEAAATREIQGDGGRFVLHFPEGTAELTFTILAPDLVRADHTEVPPSLTGRGIARRLFDALAQDARAQGYRIEPACDYVAAQARKNPALSDLFTGPGFSGPLSAGRDITGRG